MFGPGFRVCTVFGIPIKVDASWFIVFGLITWGQFQAYQGMREMAGRPEGNSLVMGIAAALLLFVSVLLHELGHCAVARAYGMRINGITLFILGGVAETADESPRPGVEFLVAVAGPLVSALLAGAFYALFRAREIAGYPLPPQITLVSETLAGANAALVVFNMLPGFPMDGGRVLRSVLWKATGSIYRATRVAAVIGRGFGMLFILAGLGLTVFTGGANFLMLSLVGLFLRFAAGASVHQLVVKRTLEGVQVSFFMETHADTVNPDLSLENFIDDHLYVSLHRCYPVVAEGFLEGVILSQFVEAIPADRRAAMRVRDVMDENLILWTIHPDTDAIRAYARMLATGRPRLIVTRDEEVVGVLSLEDMVRFMDLKARMEL
ncbi:MAG: site-2 protease family protein [Planctomycetes bacterium]|nr:site-2 protease family protein [Planctomycetota bacterium]